MVLFIDTVSPVPKIILSGNSILSSFEIPINNDIQISESLITKLLKTFKNNFDIKKIKKVGVCTGPGSFTGLRMGIATAIGFKTALNLPLYGFTAFEILLNYSRSNYSSKNIYVFVQSGNNQNFYAAFDSKNNFFIKPQKIHYINDSEQIKANSMLISNYKINQENLSYGNSFTSVIRKDISEIVASYNFDDFKPEQDILSPLYIST